MAREATLSDQQRAALNEKISEAEVRAGLGVNKVQISRGKSASSEFLAEKTTLESEKRDLKSFQETTSRLRAALDAKMTATETKMLAIDARIENGKEELKELMVPI